MLDTITSTSENISIDQNNNPNSQKILINLDEKIAKHSDKFNNPPSYIIGLGNYTGG